MIIGATRKFQKQHDDLPLVVQHPNQRQADLLVTEEAFQDLEFKNC